MTATTATGNNPLAGTKGSLPAASAGKKGSGDAALGSTTSAADQSANFLKMLVAQMQNQDPMNPMDNAQVTSQMAQISTVQGIESLNTTMAGMNTQFTRLQTLQGASLIGKDVAIEGDDVRVNAATGRGDGGFELSTAATGVKVEVLNSAGQTIATSDMGALESGRHSFDVAIPESSRGQALTFKVTALNKSTAVETMPLSYDRVNAVSSLDGSTALELDNGRRVAYDAVWSIL